jgi:hypothetical protein
VTRWNGVRKAGRRMNWAKVDNENCAVFQTLDSPGYLTDGEK